MVTIKQVLKDAVQQLSACRHVTTAQLDAEILLSHAIGKSREYLIGHEDDLIAAEFVQSLTQRRLSGEPIAYITGKKDFWKREFKVTKDTLIPRPETELIIEKALEIFTDKKTNLEVLDLGTGTGCIMLSILEEFPNAVGVGVDISNKALDIAKENALGNSRVEFIQSNWFDNLGDRKFDLIVSNPPYISKSESLGISVVDFEPHSALFAEDDGYKCYKIIAKDIKKHLKKNGVGIFEFGQGQSEKVADIFKFFGFRSNKICMDLAGIDRVIMIQN